MCQVTGVAPDVAMAGRCNGIDAIGGLCEVATDGDAFPWRAERQSKHASRVTRRNRGISGGPRLSEVIGTEDARRVAAGAEVRRVAGRDEAVAAGGEAEVAAFQHPAPVRAVVSRQLRVPRR